MNQLSNDELRSLAENDLFIFAKGILGFELLDRAIHGPLCDRLQKFEENRRARIVLPRSWLKTTLCTQAYPIWRSVKAKGDIRILVVQNTYENAVAKLKVIKDQWETNEILRTLWPELVPDKNNVWKGDSLCLNRPRTYAESTYEAAGIATRTVSRHYNIIIEDDTVSPRLNELGEENVAPVKEDIAQAIGFHRGVTDLQTDFEKDQILIVGTRWFEKDLISWSQEHEPSYTHYERACLENEKGEADEHGQPTYPSRFPRKVLEEIRAAKGEYMFSCLYLNKPIRSDNMLFKSEWFKYFADIPLGLTTYTTVDPGGDPEDTKGEPDWNVVMTCGVDISTGRKYVLHYDRERCNMSRLIDLIFLHNDLYHPAKVGVEAIQYQKAIIHVLRNEMRKRETYLNVVPLTHGRKPKDFRIKALQPSVENGSLMFREHMQSLISEALVFPYGKHDDLIDCLSMQLPLWGLLQKPEETPVKEEFQPHQLQYHLNKVQEKRGKTEHRKRIMGLVSLSNARSSRISVNSRGRVQVSSN